MIPAYPQVLTQVAWSNNPFDTSLTWFDISSRVSELHTDTGAPPLVGTVEPSTMWLLARNLDGRFDPTITSGPYGSGVDVGRRIRSIAVMGNLLADPSFEVGTAGWTGALCTLAQTTAQALDGTHSLSVTTTTTGGFLAVSPRALPAGGGPWTITVAVRAAATPRAVTVQVNWFDIDGGSLTSQSATATDSTTAWTTISFVANAPVGTASATVQVSTSVSATSEVHYIDKVGVLAGTNAWATQTTQPLFDGYIDHYEEQWDGYLPFMKITASDMLRILNGTPAVDTTTYVSQVTAQAGLQAYYRLSDGAGTTTTADSSGNSRSGTWSAGVAVPLVRYQPVSPGALIADRDLAGEFNQSTPQQARTLTSGYSFSGTGPTGFSLWINLHAVPTGTFPTTTGYYVIAYQDWLLSNTAHVQRFAVVVNKDGFVHLVAQDGSSGAVILQLDSNVPVADGQWHLVAWERDTGNTPASHALLVDGTSVTGTINTQPWNFQENGSLTPLTFGGKTAGTNEFDGAMDEIAVYAGSSITLTPYILQYTYGRNQWTGNTSQVRISLLLGLAGVPTGQQAIDSGGITLATAPSPLYAQSVGAAIEDARVSEEGWTFVTPDGIFTSKVRQTATLTSALTVGPSGVPYTAVPGVKVDSDEVLNQISVSLPNQSSQTAINSTSKTRFAVRGQYPSGTTIQSQLASVSDALALATRLVTNLGASHARVNNIVLSGPSISNSSAGWAGVLALRLYNGVTAQRPAMTVTRPSILTSVEGIQHDIVDKGQWDVTLRLAAAP